MTIHLLSSLIHTILNSSSSDRTMASNIDDLKKVIPDLEHSFGKLAGFT